ncbi:hypothetical protein EDD37DRAFT_214927 [Exophiala viscosa]|uniref:uncharacterized protein n=1 Tax=Exophiala viscosa TaxID=2486360 RepID=UPI0021989E42|nr:hypothetical protein EDD37DRAFT_214927 [Exophiala viscosa]
MLLFGLPDRLPRYVVECLIGTLGTLFEIKLELFEELAGVELWNTSLAVLAARTDYYSILADVVRSRSAAANCSADVPFVLAFVRENTLKPKDMFFDILGSHRSKATPVEWARHRGARWVLTNVLESSNSTATMMEHCSNEQNQQESLRRLVQGLGRSLAGYFHFWIDWIEVTRDYQAHVAERELPFGLVPDRDLRPIRNNVLADLDQNRDACKIFRVWHRFMEGANGLVPRRKDLEPSNIVWEECFGKAERYEQAVTIRLQTDAALLSLEESKKSIKEAESVGRLTQLAFVFVPLTFTTGVFGMNIVPFGGHAPIKFWITATLLSVGAMVLWSMFKRLENMADLLADFFRHLVRRVWWRIYYYRVSGED